MTRLIAILFIFILGGEVVLASGSTLIDPVEILEWVPEVESETETEEEKTEKGNKKVFQDLHPAALYSSKFEKLSARNSQVYVSPYLSLLDTPPEQF